MVRVFSVLLLVICFQLSDVLSLSSQPSLSSWTSLPLRGRKTRTLSGEQLFRSHLKSNTSWSYRRLHDNNEVSRRGGNTAPYPSSTSGVPTSSMRSSSTMTQAKLTPRYTKYFPIYPQELSKFFSLSAMMFWIIFVFSMARDTKDTLIVTNCGAEAIAFLKVYGVIPAVTAFMMFYTKLANRFDSKTLFYITLAPFFAFYSLFAFFLYPLRHHIHPMHWRVPAGGLAYPVNLMRHWSFTLYYIMSELWGSAGIPLLFWSCANSLVTLEQSSRWYPLLSLVGNIGPIFSGIVMNIVSKSVSNPSLTSEDAFEKSLKLLTSCMLVAGGLITWLHHHLHYLYSSYPEASIDSSLSTSAINNTLVFEQKHQTPQRMPKKKAKLSFVDSVKLLVQDKYLMNIALMVLSYGLAIEFTEIMWKSTVKKAFPLKNDYLAFMGRYSSLVGMMSFVMMFIGAKINQLLGWRLTALTTPVLMGLTALPFFASIIFGGVESKKSLFTAVYVGLIQNAMSKAAKYAIFDPTKEMTYIPLSQDAKTQGKAAIDVFGARLGKSGGALIQQLLVFFFGNILTGAPLVASMFYAVVAMWIDSLNSLYPMFLAKSRDNMNRGDDAA